VILPLPLDFLCHWVCVASNAWLSNWFSPDSPAALGFPLSLGLRGVKRMAFQLVFADVFPDPVHCAARLQSGVFSKRLSPAVVYSVSGLCSVITMAFLVFAALWISMVIRFAWRQTSGVPNCSTYLWLSSVDWVEHRQSNGFPGFRCAMCKHGHVASSAVNALISKQFSWLICFQCKWESVSPTHWLFWFRFASRLRLCGGGGEEDMDTAMALALSELEGGASVLFGRSLRCGRLR
jgi:hypothetical protein